MKVPHLASLSPITFTELDIVVYVNVPSTRWI